MKLRKGDSMNLGNQLYNARKKSGYSQETVAEKLGVSRQTISKWETDETLPDIRQTKRLSILYGMSLDALIAFDVEVDEIKHFIENTNEAVSDKIDWRGTWSKKYPVLKSYQDKVLVDPYVENLELLLSSLIEKYNFSELDAFLVLKDILYQIYQKQNKK